MIEMIRYASAAAMRCCRPDTAGDCALTLLVFIGAAACAFMPLAFLFWVMQPKVLASPAPHVPAVARYTYPEPPLRDAEATNADAPSASVRQFTRVDAQLRPEPGRQRQARAHHEKRKRVVEKRHASVRSRFQSDGRASGARSIAILPPRPLSRDREFSSL
jgi:hypothetical protein